MSAITSPRPPAAPARERPSASPERLATYTQPDGLVREVLVIVGAQASRLVVDRLAGGLGDTRLLAHLAADEPDGNARLLCELYLNDPSRGCRVLCAEDRRRPPTAAEQPPVSASGSLMAADGALYSIGEVVDGRGPVRLRWRATRPGVAPVAVRLREVVGHLQAYEPARTLTAQAIGRHERHGRVSVQALRSELERLDASPVVLNRRLREAVLARVASGQLSFSEIALRCGRAKRDRHGSCSGETTWLARRIGHAPEANQQTPTPWVHSDTLALIAREGLGVAPSEVEL